MSRHLKRVPMNFAWPLKQVWGGYINPYYDQAGECPDCENGHDRAGGRPAANAALFSAQWYGHAPFDPAAYGAAPLSQHATEIWDFARYNVRAAPDYYMTDRERAALAKFKRDALTGFDHDDPLVPFPSFDQEAAITREARRLYLIWKDQWCHHLIQADVDALLAADRLWEFTRVPRDAGQALVVAIRRGFHDTNGWLPEPNGHRPTAAEVNAWSLMRGIGHDGLNQGTCVEARCAREGVPYLCARCEGSSHVWPSPEIRQRCEDWTREDPPTGDGYQLWEDCSEGSPVSPVFDSIDTLCAWAADNATTFASHRADASAWKEMLTEGVVHHREGNLVIM